MDGDNGSLVPAQDPPALATGDPGARSRTRPFVSGWRSAHAHPCSSEYDERAVFARFGALLRQLAEARRVMFERVRARFPFLANAGYATLTAGSAALLLVLLMIAARFLSADDYGRFAWAFALTTIVETVMDAGLGQLSVRATGRDKDWAGGAFGHVLGLKLVWVAVGLAILVIVTPILKSDPRIIKLCYLMGISSAVRSYLLTARGVLQGLGRFDLEALAVVSDRVLLLAAAPPRCGWDTACSVWRSHSSASAW